MSLENIQLRVKVHIKERFGVNYELYNYACVYQRHISFFLNSTSILKLHVCISEIHALYNFISSLSIDGLYGRLITYLFFFLTHPICELSPIGAAST